MAQLRLQPKCNLPPPGRALSRTVASLLGDRRQLGRFARPEIGADVVRKQIEHVIRNLPFRRSEPQLEEAIDRNPDQLQARVEWEVELVEHGFALAKQLSHLGHELIDRAVDLACDGASAGLNPGRDADCLFPISLELHQALYIGPAES